MRARLGDDAGARVLRSGRRRGAGQGRPRPTRREHQHHLERRSGRPSAFVKVVRAVTSRVGIVRTALPSTRLFECTAPGVLSTGGRAPDGSRSAPPRRCRTRRPPPRSGPGRRSPAGMRAPGVRPRDLARSRRTSGSAGGHARTRLLLVEDAFLPPRTRRRDTFTRRAGVPPRFATSTPIASTSPGATGAEASPRTAPRGSAGPASAAPRGWGRGRRRDGQRHGHGWVGCRRRRRDRHQHRRRLRCGGGTEPAPAQVGGGTGAGTGIGSGAGGGSGREPASAREPGSAGHRQRHRRAAPARHRLGAAAAAGRESASAREPGSVGGHRHAGAAGVGRGMGAGVGSGPVPRRSP
jgi:hypothetical protein